MENTSNIFMDIRSVSASWLKLNIDKRQHFARKAPKEALAIIISQENNDLVLESLLLNEKTGSAEIIRIIDRAKTSRLLEKISKNSRWFTNHVIKRRLLENPHTPITVSFRILEFLPLPEAIKIVQNTNLSRDVRNRAKARLRTLLNRLSDGEIKALFLNSEGEVIKKLPVLSGKDKKVIIDLVNSQRVSRRFIINLLRAPATTADIVQIISRNRNWTRDKYIRSALLSCSKVPQSTKNKLKNY